MAALILTRPVRIEHRVSNSRFIATLRPAVSVDEARAVIASIREEMPDATHHVYAFAIGHGNSVTEGMSDDGEPSGTSGPPALAVLRGSGLGDVVLVITRYFGGTKLGTGGLVSAYGDAARLAIEAAETREKIARTAIELHVPYAHHDRVRRIAEDAGAIVEHEQFAVDVALRLLIPDASLKSFCTHVRDATGGQVEPRMDE
ncbi:YigZ family protein [bacterium]|nr:YigZ family protein [bacterium]